MDKTLLSLTSLISLISLSRFFALIPPGLGRPAPCTVVRASVRLSWAC